MSERCRTGRMGAWIRGAHWAVLGSASLLGTACAAPRFGGPVAAEAVPAEPPSAAHVAQVRERAIELLVAEAAGPVPERRANAIEALLLAPARLKPVLPAALADPNPGVRAVAAMVVGRGAVTEAAGQAEALLADPSPFVRAAAIYALRRAGRAVDPSPLGPMLVDPNPRLRAHAAFILGELGEQSALPMLREAARDPMLRARQAEVRITLLQLAEARIKLGDEEALHEVRAALYPSRPEDLEATALAAQIIGQVRDRGSVDQLIYLTARRDDVGNLMPAEIRLAAARSLAQMGLREGDFLAREFAASRLAPLRAQAAIL
ncbi:MAG TPA: HEAT repeat domain-containing protein, partial [Phycisphaerales bacterium]|nr:HEAT repeat domain-containing protein [Phycisphaerales bacterium]